MSGPARAHLQAELGRQAQHQAYAQAQAAAARQTMLSATEQAASRALMWGLLSFAFFCLPVFNVLAFLGYKRAQASARAAGVGVPTRATTGLVCALITGVLCVVCWVWMITDIRADNARAEVRKAELSKLIAASPNTPALAHPLACALAEQYLLNNGFDGATNSGAFREVSCAGKLREVKDRAELVDFSFRVSSSGGSKTATACFKHGERWFVESLRATGCELEP